MAQFKYLFSPFKIRNVALKNRFVFLPHNPVLGFDNKPSERQAYYFAERAKGGTGLIVMGSNAVHPSGVWDVEGGREVWSFDDSVIPGYRRITEMVHENDGKIFCQLTHFGNQGTGYSTMMPLLAPSAVRDPTSLENPKEIEIEEIREIIQAFSLAAERVKKGGFDGVEIKVAHDGILRQFLSPLTNRRGDEYGGSVENRTRLTLEVCAAVKSRVGSDYPLGIRFCMDEFLPGGYTLEDAKGFAEIFAKSSHIDYLSSDIGTDAVGPVVISDMSVPPGYALPAISAIREVVGSKPLIAFGRLNDPVLAEKILADNTADLIGMARALIADPELPNKAREGILDEIRYCIGCNQNCLGRVWLRQPLGCIHNPAVGREKYLGMGTLKQAAVKKRVVIIGGGPAGLKVAEVAAKAGHSVTLLEGRSALGGQVSLAARVPNRQEFEGIVRYLIFQIRKLGVEVRLNTTADAKTVLDMCPDSVIVATGSSPFRPEIPGAEQPNVIDVREAIENPAALGETVAIYDHEGHWQTASAVDTATSQGRKVSVLTKWSVVAPLLEFQWQHEEFYRRMKSKGVVIHPHRELRGISGKYLTVADTYTGEEHRVGEFDTVILCGFNRTKSELYFELKGKVKELYRIGDCLAPRRADLAIWDGEKIGRAM